MNYVTVANPLNYQIMNEISKFKKKKKSSFIHPYLQGSDEIPDSNIIFLRN